MNILEGKEAMLAIVPTVMIPLAVIGVAMSVAATTIAGFFGVKLKAEGPRQLLEVLLKPKVLMSAVVLNLVIWAGVMAFDTISTMAKPAFWITWKNRENLPSTLTYTDAPYRQLIYPRSLIATKPHEVRPLWTRQVGEGSFRAPTISGSSAFISSEDGFVYELNITSGQVNRKFYVGTSVSPSSMVWKNYLYVGEGDHQTHHARIYKFDLTSGKLAASTQTLGHTEAQPRMVKTSEREVLLFPAGSDGVYAVDPKTMTPVWHQNDGHCDAEIQSKNGLVFVATGRDSDDAAIKPYAVTYDLQSGKRLWKQELIASSFMSPVLYDEEVCFITGEIYFKSDIGGLFCFDQKSGQPTRSINHIKPLTGVPLRIGQNVYVADIEGRVCAFDLEEKKSQWCRLLGKKDFSYSSVTYDPHRDLLLFAHKTGGLFALNPDTGKTEINWLPKTPSWQKTYASTMVTESNWIIADMQGTIRALTPFSTKISKK